MIQKHKVKGWKNSCILESLFKSNNRQLRLLRLSIQRFKCFLSFWTSQPRRTTKRKTEKTLLALLRLEKTQLSTRTVVFPASLAVHVSDFFSTARVGQISVRGRLSAACRMSDVMCSDIKCPYEECFGSFLLCGNSANG